MNFNELPLENSLLADRSIAIKLVGIGGAGSNAVDRLKMENLERLQLTVINTDHQALATSPVQEKVLIGYSVTRGLSAGGDPELGREAAEADREKIATVVKDCDLVFLVAGLGGGTGGGASPIVAEIAAETGALVIAFVAMPFTCEGGRRRKQAEDGLRALRAVCDAVIPLPNDLLLQEAGENEAILASFARADEWIGRGVKSIWSMLFKTGLINLDFASLRQAFHTRGGKTLFGFGEGTGENAVADTLASLKLCPLLHLPEYSRKADRLLVNIVGGPDLTLVKVNEIMTAVSEQFGCDAGPIMGAVVDEAMNGRVEVCVIGTSDMGGGRSLPPRRPAANTRKTQAPFPARSETAPGAAPAAAPATAGGQLPPDEETSIPVPPAAQPMIREVTLQQRSAQGEFAGFGEVEDRGHFEKTDRNLFDGQDLDVPTYLRKGVKIVL